MPKSGVREQLEQGEQSVLTQIRKTQKRIDKAVQRLNVDKERLRGHRQFLATLRDLKRRAK